MKSPIHVPTRPAGVLVLRLLAMVLVVGFLAAHSVGCTILFPLVTSQSRSTSRGEIVAAEDLFVLDPGVRLRVSDAEGAVAEGTFRGIARDSMDAYAVRYARLLKRSDRWPLPQLGENVRFVRRSMMPRVEPRVGQFAGFDYRGVLIREDDGAVKRFEMVKVDSLWREDGQGVSGFQLASLDADHELPSRTMLVVEQSAHDADGIRRTQRMRVPWESAHRVESITRVPSTTQAMIAGLAFDTAILVIATRKPAKREPVGCDADLPYGWPFYSSADLRHVHRAESDFDRLAGEFVTDGAALATR